MSIEIKKEIVYKKYSSQLHKNNKPILIKKKTISIKITDNSNEITHINTSRHFIKKNPVISAKKNPNVIVKKSQDNEIELKKNVIIKNSKKKENIIKKINIATNISDIINNIPLKHDNILPNKIFKMSTKKKYLPPRIHLPKKYLYNIKLPQYENKSIKFCKKKNYVLKIPRNIFRTFKYEYDETLKLSWINNHPNFKYYFFDHPKRLEFIKENFNKEIYDTYITLNSGASRADLWRCCVLYLYGGVYTDIDTLCLGNLEDVLDDNDFVIPIDSCITKSSFFNAFISSTPRNNILYHQINRIINNVKNKLYAGNTFLIAGPASFGQTISNCLDNVIDTLYSQTVLEHKISKFNKYDCISTDDNKFYLPKNTDKVLTYDLPKHNGYDIKINDKYLELNDVIDTQKINHLYVAVNNTSAITIQEKFYFSNYNYDITIPTYDNEKIIDIYHNEYEKLKNNIEFLKFNYSIHLTNDDETLLSNSYKFEVLKCEKNNLSIKIIKFNNKDYIQLTHNLKISIYYDCLKFNTNDINISDAKFIVYDNLEHIKSNCVDISDILVKNLYTIKIIDNNNFLVSLNYYNYYLPETTIINYEIGSPNYPQSQKIRLIEHLNRPEFIYHDKKKIIQTQVEQSKKDSISIHYSMTKTYNDDVIYYNNNIEKIASICCDNTIHQLQNILFNYKNNIDYFIDKNFNSSWICYFKEKFNIIFKHIDLFDHLNYDKIFYFNLDDIKDYYSPPEKIIIINTIYKNISQYTKNQLIDTYLFNKTKYNYMLPIVKFLKKKEKINILKNEKTINVFCDSVVDEDIFNKIFNSENKINVYTNSEQIATNNNINIINLDNSVDEKNILQKCHYYISFDIDINKQLIFTALGFGCQLLLTPQKLLVFDIVSALDINEITCVKSTGDKHNINFDKIFDNIDSIIERNNKVIEYVLNDCKLDLF